MTSTELRGIPVVTFGENDPKIPVVVCLQEWWGINEEMKVHAKRIHDQGYFVVVPDLYKGKMALEEEEAHHLLENLNFPTAVQEICQVISELRVNNPSRKVGITGFCMGGALSLGSSPTTESKDLSSHPNCCAPFYGVPPSQLIDLSKITIPVLGQFGELDTHKGFSALEDAQALEEKLKKAGVEHSVIIEPGQGHGYMNESDFSIKFREKKGFPSVNKDAIEASWKRLFEFFAKHLH